MQTLAEMEHGTRGFQLDIVTGKGLAFFSARARCGQWLLSSITTGDHHGHDHPRATQPRRL
ncbi:hypothetical protein, partial [Thiococcus pfennigii]|uniref:hypothetical protein n=1 Tax=Thiococcus pfennigii TaxID=1057 RepID=UPI001A924E3D